MGMKNFLIEGSSGTGKSSVGRELRRRGYFVVDGDNELAYQGDPITGEPVAGFAHEHHIWNVHLVHEFIRDKSVPMTFFCGGSRNFPKFIDRFDAVFVLQIDAETLQRRLNDRPADEWGGTAAQKESIARLHRTQEDVPTDGVGIDATAPLSIVVDEILRVAIGTADPEGD